MISPENEKVAFTIEVNVVEGEKNGNVEKWLKEIEEVMRITLKKIGVNAIQDKSKRIERIFKYPAMTALMDNMVYWTRETEIVI